MGHVFTGGQGCHIRRRCDWNLHSIYYPKTCRAKGQRRQHTDEEDGNESLHRGWSAGTDVGETEGKASGFIGLLSAWRLFRHENVVSRVLWELIRIIEMLFITFCDLLKMVKCRCKLP